MVTYKQAETIAIKNTIPDGKVYYSGDAGTFYIFRIVTKDFPTDIPGVLFGSTFPAVDKSNGRFWTYNITDPLPNGVKEIKPIVQPGK